MAFDRVLPGVGWYMVGEWLGLGGVWLVFEWDWMVYGRCVNRIRWYLVGIRAGLFGIQLVFGWCLVGINR